MPTYGAALERAINGNGRQMSLPGYEAVQRTDDKPRNVESAPLIWLLLVLSTPTELRAELSLALEIDEGRVTRWRERIILPVISRLAGPSELQRVIPSKPIEIPVKRKRAAG